MVEQFVGSWEIAESNNFGEYLKAIGAPAKLSDAGDSTTPKLEITQKDGNKMTVDIDNGPPTNFQVRVKFTLGEEFDETTSDGRKGIKTTVTYEDNKLVYTQRWDGKEAKTYRQVVDGMLTTKLTYGDVVCVRKYKRVNPA